MENKNPFTLDDYNSGDGMMTSIWGPPMWHILHTISFNYPIKPTQEDKNHYYDFYKNIKNILPCKYCRDNLVKNLKNHKLTKSIFKNRETLSIWVYELHEIVNKMLEKKSGLSYNDVRNRYEHFRSRCLIDRKIKTSGESGCTESLYGVKSKCVINIVPRNSNTLSFKMDPKCIIKKK
jgi:hypothetical protein